MSRPKSFHILQNRLTFVNARKSNASLFSSQVRIPLTEILYCWHPSVNFSFWIIWLQVKERLQDLVLSTEQALEIKSKLNHEIEQGLGKDTHVSASVKCFITYVQDLPNSTGKNYF